MCKQNDHYQRRGRGRGEGGGVGVFISVENAISLSIMNVCKLYSLAHATPEQEGDVFLEKPVPLKS